MNNQAYVENIRNELEKIYNGEAVNDDGEQISFYSYVSEEVLDYDITIDRNRYMKGCRAFVTLGGPTVWIDTLDHEVKLAWGTEKASAWLPSEIC